MPPCHRLAAAAEEAEEEEPAGVFQGEGVAECFRRCQAHICNYIFVCVCVTKQTKKR